MSKKVKSSIAVAIIVVLGGGYFVGNHFAKKEANVKAKEVISQIKSQSPEIKDITYKSIDVGVLSAITHSFSLNNVDIVLNGQTLTIGQINVDDFSLGKDNLPSSFNVTFKHINLKDQQAVIKKELAFVDKQKKELEKALKDKNLKPKVKQSLESYLQLFTIYDALVEKYATTYGELTVKYSQAHKTLDFFTKIMVENKQVLDVSVQLTDYLLSKGDILDNVNQSHIGNFDFDLNLNHPLVVSDPKMNQFIQTKLHNWDPTGDVTFNYDPKKGTFTFKSDIDNAFKLPDSTSLDHQKMTFGIGLADVDLNKYSIEDLSQAYENNHLLGLEKAYILGTNTNIDMNVNVTKDFLLDDLVNEQIGMLLNQLPYKNYDLFIQGNSTYDSKNGDALSNMVMGLKDKLIIQGDSKTKINGKLTVKEYINMWQSLLNAPESENKDESDYQAFIEALENSAQASESLNNRMDIVKWQYTLENKGEFLGKIYQLASNVLHTKPESVAVILKAITAQLLATQNGILPVSEYETSLNQFMDKPENLQISIEPKDKATVADFYQALISFLKLQQAEEVEHQGTLVMQTQNQQNLNQFKEAFQKLNFQVQAISKN